MAPFVELSVEEVEDPRRWYSTNLVGLSSPWLASVHFNERPSPLHIAATRQTYSGLFNLLAQVHTQPEAAEIFAHFMDMAFGVRKQAKGEPREQGSYWKSSYMKLLQGWGFDSNSPQGAVLKGWVESRFGIVPTYHREPLQEFPSEAWMKYLEEKFSSRFHNNCIQLQLDLLYEYCQFCLRHLQPFGRTGHVTLHRGIERSEAEFRSGSVRERHGVLRFNNLVSFSLDRERSETFGELIVSTEVPFEKLLFYPGLIEDRVLNGEGEVLVIGGDFDVSVSYL